VTLLSDKSVIGEYYASLLHGMGIDILKKVVGVTILGIV